MEKDNYIIKISTCVVIPKEGALYVNGGLSKNDLKFKAIKDLMDNPTKLELHKMVYEFKEDNGSFIKI